METATILTTTVVTSLGIAFALEWLCLRSVTAFMPVRQSSVPSAIPAAVSKQH
ncbi:MAG TPA: hypothetical protein VJN90_06445 [Candidatus Acidoferrales bacterium]|nr:hypothetical protein [Candidatus Acidoferrales bacterium]